MLAKHNIESIKVAMTPTAMVVYCSVLIQGFAHIAGYDPSSVELNSALGVKGHSQEPTQQNIELRMASAIQLRKKRKGRNTTLIREMDVTNPQRFLPN